MICACAGNGTHLRANASKNQNVTYDRAGELIEEGRRLYGLRKQTVEPVFGIIKHCMGFRQFLLRGVQKVNGEWELVTLVYNTKRLWNMRKAQA